MALYARVIDDAIVEQREIDDLPAHKAQIWRPVVIEGEGPSIAYVIEADRVRRIYSHPPITAAHVVTERARRLALGFDYNFGDARGIHRIGTTEADLRGWSEVSTYAGALIDSGDTTTTFAIVTDTGPCTITAPEWRAIEIAAAQFRQPLWAKSFVLMASNPIPADYANDQFWT